MKLLLRTLAGAFIFAGGLTVLLLVALMLHFPSLPITVVLTS